MCTLILATRVFDASTLFLASNRDEHLARPAREPMLWAHEPPFVAPRDEQEGGTWLGVNANGVLVAITNRFGAPRDPSRRSRGELVVDALAAGSAIEAAEVAARHPPGRHNPFHLVLADTTAAFTVWSDGVASTMLELDAGVHIVTERSFDAAANGRADFLRALVDELAARDALTPDALIRMLAIHRPDDLDATAVLVPQLNYGTRSSTIVDVTRRRFEFADGPPHEAAYVDYSDLLRGLLP